jgi:hypothetical protein
MKAMRIGHIAKLSEIGIETIGFEQKICSPQQMKRSLGKIVERCRTNNSTEDCRLVHNAKKRPVG